MSRIVSSVPGRIRIRDQALRNHARLDQLEAALIQIEDITSLQSNPGAGSVVLHFDGTRTDMAALEARIDATVDSALSTPLPKNNRSLKMRVNRYAKAGMLSSLATSLALAATGQKRWHAVSGSVFVACLGVHLSVYRRSLLR
jgi:hypothetical protein